MKERIIAKLTTYSSCCISPKKAVIELRFYSFSGFGRSMIAINGNIVKSGNAIFLYAQITVG